MNQIGTISETLDVVTRAKDAGLRTVISARSGETEDPALADLAVGWDGGQIKIGRSHSPSGWRSTTSSCVSSRRWATTRGWPHGVAVPRVLVTDYTWADTSVEAAVLAKIGARLVHAATGEEDELVELVGTARAS